METADAFIQKEETCSFTADSFTSNFDEYLEEIDQSCFCSSSQVPHNFLNGWFTTNSSNRFSSEKLAHKRMKQLKYGEGGFTAKHQRLQNYAFLHHLDLKQYMVQYRKYHTVGDAGKVSCEDLQWCDLMRHIRAGDRLKALILSTRSSIQRSLAEPAWYPNNSFQGNTEKDKYKLFRSFQLTNSLTRLKRPPIANISHSKLSFSETTENYLVTERSDRQQTQEINSHKIFHNFCGRIVQSEDVMKSVSDYEIDESSKIKLEIVSPGLRNNPPTTGKDSKGSSTKEMSRSKSVCRRKHKRHRKLPSLTSRSQDGETMAKKQVQIGLEVKLFTPQGLGPLKINKQKETVSAKEKNNGKSENKESTHSIKTQRDVKDLSQNHIGAINSSKKNHKGIIIANINSCSYSRLGNHNIESSEHNESMLNICTKAQQDLKLSSPRNSSKLFRNKFYDKLEALPPSPRAPPLSVQNVLLGSPYGTEDQHRDRLQFTHY